MHTKSLFSCGVQKLEPIFDTSFYNARLAKANDTTSFSLQEIGVQKRDVRSKLGTCLA